MEMCGSYPRADRYRTQRNFKERRLAQELRDGESSDQPGTIGAAMTTLDDSWSELRSVRNDTWRRQKLLRTNSVQC
jgi:hypothetical protein